MAVRAAVGRGEDVEERRSAKGAWEAVMRLLDVGERLYVWLESMKIDDSVSLSGEADLTRDHLGKLRVGVPGGNLYVVEMWPWEDRTGDYTDIIITLAERREVNVTAIGDVVAVQLDHNVYEYPPRSKKSLYFFAINRDLRKAVAEAIVRAQVGETLVRRATLWEHVEESVHEEFEDIPEPKGEVDVNPTLRLSVGEHPWFSELVYVEDLYMPLSDEAEYMYALGLRKGNDLHRIYTVSEHTMEYLINLLVRPDERARLAEVATHVARSLTRIPVIVYAVEEVLPGWFPTG